MIHSYCKVMALGHPKIKDVLDGYVYIQEKIDGSQGSFAIDEGGVVAMRSSGAQVFAETADKLFRGMVATALHLAPVLISSAVYRGEVISKLKHNTLTYGRVPKGNFVLFDVEIKPNYFCTNFEAEAERLGLEHVPVFYRGPGKDVTKEMLEEFLTRDSMLGGCKIEGVVIKNYDKFGEDGKILTAKYVSPAFVEKHKLAWKGTNPGPQDVIDGLIESLKTEARWEKAAQHLRDRGELKGTLQDIGPLIKEAQSDLEAEEKEAVIKALYDWAWPKIRRGATGGLPEWYKEKLAIAAFEPKEN